MESQVQLSLETVLGCCVAWGVLGVAFSGVGLLVEQLLRIGPPQSFTRTFWVGWCATVAVLDVVCLGWPIDRRATVLFAALAIVGLFTGSLRRRGWGQRVAHDAPWLCVTGLVAVWLSGIARGMPQNGDSFLYHLPAVEWAERFAVVPGLGNLHGRLAFNNSSTLYQALIDYDGGGFHVAHGLLVLPLFARGLRAAVRLVSGRGRSARDVLDAALLAFAVDLVMGPNLASASPDLPAGVLEAVLASELVGWIEADCPPEGTSVLVLFGLTLITVKLSGVGLAAGAGVVVAWLAWRDRKSWRRLWMTTASLVVIVIVPWVARGVILSGYPAYPSTLGGIAVDWRIPADAAENIANLVRVWGRRPGVAWQRVLGDSDWFWPWLQKIWLINREFLVPLVLGLVLLAFTAVRSFRRSHWSRLWLVLVPTVIELVFWFLTSPDPRFAGACFWLLPATGLAILAGEEPRPSTAEWRVAGAFILVVAMWPVGSLLTTGSLGWAPPAQPQATSARPFPTRWGLVLDVPDGPHGCAFKSEMLCTPMPDARLRLRRQGDLSAGFRIEAGARIHDGSATQ